MKIAGSQLIFSFVISVSVLSTSYYISCLAAPVKVEPRKLERIFPVAANQSVTFNEGIFATSLIDLSQGRPFVIVPVSNGLIAALDGDTGALAWQIKVPVPENQQAQLISTPVMVRNKLVILYQCLENGVRESHRLVVVDLVRKELDATFPVLELAAEKLAPDQVSTIKFNPPTAYSHSAVKHAVVPGSNWGTLYAAFGNAGDTQPFHGWMFEIDMDAWQQQGVNNAVTNVLLTTPEAECHAAMEFGTQEMICGGGIWTPAGPQLYSNEDSFELFVATGNGQVDLARQDYANTVMRLRPGLQFDAGCNMQLCGDFNPNNPDTACLASCKNLFIPRPAEGDAPLKPANRECDNKTFWECLAWMDYDLGASSPIKIEMNGGQSVLVQPGKDGAVYLIDAKHLGTQYDRLQIADVCGTPDDICKAGWMGMIVTQPVVAYINKEPVVVIPTFIPDQTHPAGLVALKLTLEEGMPKFKRFWQFPKPTSRKAVQTFRSHPSLPVISTLANTGDAVVWVVDIGQTGTLYGVRIKDGALMVEQSLLGTGRQLAAPLIYGDTLYLASNLPGSNKSMMEAYRIE
jgi:hypothetical protein